MIKPGHVPRVQIQVNNKSVEAFAPHVISASRATDIPAFYTKWLLEQIDKGFAERTNPFSGKKYYISFSNTRTIFFWTKNPKPIIPFLDKIPYNIYFQYTLNDYDKEKLEPNLPPLNDRIETFKKLSTMVGKTKVLWRFDPILIPPKQTIESILNRIQNIHNQLVNHTNRLTFSFIELDRYKKVKRRLAKSLTYTTHEIESMEPSDEQKLSTIKFMSELLRKSAGNNPDFTVQTCAMPENYSKSGIKQARCIDDKLLAELFPNDKPLMEFLGYGIKGFPPPPLPDDKGQRKHCHCIPSKDIGGYNTCSHGCLYCYANR